MNQQPSLPAAILKRRIATLLLAASSILSMNSCGGGGSDPVPGQAAAQAVNIVVTNDAPAVRKQGQFQAIDGYLSRSGKVLRSANGKGSAVFAPAIGERGFYRIYLWWPQAVQGAGEADVIVRHQAGVARLSVDQRLFGGQWNSIGVYELEPGAGAEVEIADRSGLSALVDAVRFEYVGKEQPALAFESTTLPLADQDSPYAAKVEVRGVGPFFWMVSEGELPAGLSLGASTGLISGTPAYLGRHSFTVRVRDGRGREAEQVYSIEVLEAASEPRGPQELDLGERKQAAEAPPAGAAPALSGLIGVIAALPEGEWAKVNLNNYSDVWTPDDLRPLLGASSPPPSKIIQAWSSFAWDSNRGDLLLFGGGHANYSGNDVYRWRGTTRRWERASLPSEIKQDDLGNWVAVDGAGAAPASAHTYDNNIFLPLIDRFVVFGGAANANGGAFLRAATSTTSRRTGPYFFDPARADPNKVGGTTGSHVKRGGLHPEIVGGNMWANRDIYINIPNSPPLPGNHVSSCTAYAQENGKDVVYVGARPPGGGTGLELYKYTVNNLTSPSLDSVAKVGIYWTGTDDQTTCGYDATRKVFFRTGINAIPFVYWNLNTPGLGNQDVRVTPTDPTGEFRALLSSNNVLVRNCGLDFDPVRKNFALWCGDGRVWAITPPATISAVGWTITKQRPPLLPVPNGDVGTGILGKWKYIYNLDAFIGLQDANQGNIWVYKPVGWRNPQGGANLRPSVAITSPAPGATFVSGKPISIAANASDLDGSVTKVEFYQGNTKIGEDLAPPFSFTWSGAPTGTSTLTAIATDNANTRTVSAAVNITVLPGATGTVILQDGINGYSLTRDAYLSSYHQTLPFGATTLMQDYSTVYTDLIRFGIFQSEGGPVPNGATIQSATLALYKFTSYDMTYGLNRMLVDWSEAGATWLQRASGLPWGLAGARSAGADYLAQADAQGVIDFNPGWLQFNVTAAVQQMANGRPNFGWRLNGISGNGNLKRFYTREYAADPSLRPKLTVTYSR